MNQLFSLRGDATIGTNTAFHASVNFEIWGYLVFHEVLFQTTEQKIS